LADAMQHKPRAYQIERIVITKKSRAAPHDMLNFLGHVAAAPAHAEYSREMPPIQ
jgi:hypothetical protein